MGSLAAYRARLEPAAHAIAALLALGGATSCLGQGPDLAPLPPGGHHVLFIGNSLTAVNDLPATVRAIATAAGDTLRTMTVTGGNLGLIDHLTGATNAVDAIRLGGWEYVVLQQGPTSTGGVCQDSLVLWTRVFDTHIRAVNARPALFMVWPATDRLAYFDNVRAAYQEAAAAVGGVFLPAGEAWRAAWDADSTLALYGGDGFHPSPVGTFLAALTIYERLTGRDARTLPAVAFANGAPLALPDATIRLLQGAAHTANSASAAATAPRGTPRRADPHAAPRAARC